MRKTIYNRRIYLFILVPVMTMFFTSNVVHADSKKLFNGKDLSGWHNPYRHGDATVVDGEIHLLGDEKFFLLTNEKYADFTFEAEVKMPEGRSNSGFLFRCQKREDGSAFGYQAEVDTSDRRWSGGLYDEGRRRWLHPKKPIRGNPYNDKYWTVERRNAFNRYEWNRYKIKCKEDHIQIWVNGVLTTDLHDKVDREGYIGLQHHGEKGQLYRFRNISITTMK